MTTNALQERLRQEEIDAMSAQDFDCSKCGTTNIIYPREYDGVHSDITKGNALDMDDDAEWSFLNRGMPEKRALVLLRQMMSATEACHRADMAHLDLKPENFVFKVGEARPKREEERERGREGEREGHRYPTIVCMFIEMW